MADEKKKLARTLAVFALLGAVAGVVTRLSVAHRRTNAEVLPTQLGLIVFICIGGGLMCIISGWQQWRALRLALGIFLLAAGLALLIPLSN